MIRFSNSLPERFVFVNRGLTEHNMKTEYKCHFGCKVVDQDKKWAPHICCNSCCTQLLRWDVGKQKKMPFADFIMVIFV